jgi:hypothetical protein
MSLVMIVAGASGSVGEASDTIRENSSVASLELAREPVGNPAGHGTTNRSCRLGCAPS